MQPEILEGVDLYKCRMYENELPQEGEIVMAQIKSLNEMGADCVLLEYAKCEAFLGISECSKKNKVKNIRKLLRVGKLEPLQVIRVEAEKGYIDLSKKYMTHEEGEECNEKFQKSKAIHSIFNRLSDTMNIEMGNLLSEVCWPLYGSFDSAYDCLEKCTRKGTLIGELDVFHEFPVNTSGVCHTLDEWKTLQEELQKLLNHRFQPKEVTVEALVQVTCFGFDGIDAVKKALLAGRDQETEENPLTITTCANGFNVRTKGYDEDIATKVIKQSLAAIKKEIDTFSSGGFKITKEPYVVC